MRRHVLLLALLLGVLPRLALGATTLELAVGSVTSVFTTQMNSITNNSFTVASSAIDNRIGQTMNGYSICRMIAHVVYAANPSAGAAITGWFLKNSNVTTPAYETTPTSSITLNRLPDFVIPAVGGQTTTDTSVDVRCVGERFLVVIQNTASGQSWAASGNTLTILPLTLQGN